MFTLQANAITQAQGYQFIDDSARVGALTAKPALGDGIANTKWIFVYLGIYDHVMTQ